MSQRGRPGVDDSLLRQVAALSRGGQRWLRTALQSIATMGPPMEQEERESAAALRGAERPRGAGLDEVLSGEVGLREQAEAYPELTEELEELTEIAGMLREVGEERRRLGEEILREEMLREREIEGEDEEPN